MREAGNAGSGGLKVFIMQLHTGESIPSIIADTPFATSQEMGNDILTRLAQDMMNDPPRAYELGKPTTEPGA